MHALVADVPVAEIPKPMPIVMHEVGVIRSLSCRASPEIEVNLRRWRDLGFEADAIAQLVDYAARHPERSIMTRSNHLSHLLVCCPRAALRSVLHAAIGFSGDFDCNPTLVNVVAAWLLDVDILAGLAGPNGH